MPAARMLSKNAFFTRMHPTSSYNTRTSTPSRALATSTSRNRRPVSSSQKM